LNRLVLFFDPRHLAARILLPALLEAVAGREDMECVALLVSESGRGVCSVLRWWLDKAVRLLQVAMGSGHWERALAVGPVDLPSLAQKYGIETRWIPAGDPNHPKILAYLRREPHPNLAVNLYCTRRFREKLLKCFDIVANYHNGSLPEFRGLRATNWSIYMGRPVSGFAFHRMDEGLDTGRILCSGEVPVYDWETPADLELRKAMEARCWLPLLLGALARGDVGCPHLGMGCNHDKQAHELMTRVPDPTALSRREWESRLRAFLRINALLGGRWWPVTGVASSRSGGRLAFRSADGEWLRVTGIDFWPAAWIRWFRRPEA
jgi:methionyl-tRNA formyltransferase